MKRIRNFPILSTKWIYLWLLMLVVFIYFQVGYYNYDSKKYFAIALQMLQSHQYLLPYFDGHPYSDKGPLMFWLFVSGWKMFGVNLWWPQLVMFIFATGIIIITRQLARLFWPTDKLTETVVPFILLGMPTFLGNMTQIRIDVPLTFFILLGIYALVRAYQNRSQAWLIYGVAIVLAGLCKGPVVLLFTLLPGLFFPYLLEAAAPKHWPAKIIAISLLSLMLVLLWAIPAAMMGGKSFSQAILYQQITHRAHEHTHFLAYFYYILRLPLLALPWLLFLPVYYGYSRDNDLKTAQAEKIILLIIGISLVIFSFYGEKRLHYINVDIPLLALLIARGISLYQQQQGISKRFYQGFVGSLWLIVALIPYIFPLFHLHLDSRTSMELAMFFQFKNYFVIPFIGLAIFYYRYQFKNIEQQAMAISLAIAGITTAFIVLNMLGGNALAKFPIMTEIINIKTV